MGLCEKTYLCLIGVPESHENESKLENILQDIIQEKFPNLVRQDNTQLQVKEHYKDIPQVEQPQDT